MAQQYLPIQDQILSEINALRKKALKRPLTYNVKYQADCDRWAKHITKSLNHNNKDYFKGEIISEILVSEDLIIPMFMKSASHKAVLMDRKVKSICLAVYSIPAKTIVHQDGVEFIPESFYTVIRTY